MSGITSQSGHDTSSRLLALDGIRGIACLTIVVYHYVGLAIDGRNLSGIPYLIAVAIKLLTNSGWSGVDLFFILSGFLIGGILIDNRNAINYYKVFYIRRFCRILPLYFLLLIICYSLANAPSLPLSTLTKYLAFNDSVSPLSYLTFTQNFAMISSAMFGLPLLHITWSLAVEEQFYLVLPLFIKLIPFRRLPWILVLFVLAGPLFRNLILDIWGPIAAYVLLLSRIDALMLGVLFAYLSRQPIIIQKLASMHRVLYSLLSILFVGVVWLTVAHGMYQDPIMLSFGYSWVIAFYGCFFLLVITGNRGLVRVLTENRFTVYIGRLAYGIYLFHMMVLTIVHGLIFPNSSLTTLPGILVTVGSFGLTICVAQLVFSAIETPFIRLGRKFSYDKPEFAPVSLNTAPVVNADS